MSTGAETSIKESRIGKQIVPIPAGGKVTVGEREIEVVGPKGRLVAPLSPGVKAEQDASGIRLRVDRAEDRPVHGLVRALLANAVKGVTDGFMRELDIVGVGYKADLKGRILTLTLGYSHPV